MQAIENAFSGLNRSLSSFFSNPYVSTALTVFALVFASLAAPNLPPAIASLFDSTIFKIFYLFLILVLLQYNVVVALIAALAFVLALQSLQRYRSFSYLQDRASQVQDRARQALLPVTGAITGAVSGAQSAALSTAAAAGNFVDRVGDTALGFGRDVVSAPGQVISAIPSGISNLGDSLRNIPSAFSTSVDSIFGNSANSANSAAFVDVNTGCPVPTSCQNSCGGQPMPPTALPPVENTEVTGLCGCDSEGPQGLRFPPGYENLGMGYSL